MIPHLNGDHPVPPSAPGPLPLLGHMLSLRRRLTTMAAAKSLFSADTTEDTGDATNDSEIHGQCTSLLAEGTENVACTLSWVWYLLSSRPDVEELVRAEVDRVLDGRPARYEDFANLEYLQRAVTETLRMYPSVWLTMRSATVVPSSLTMISERRDR